MDAGGLTQMTYNSSFNGGTLGVPTAGFASRGKGAHIKRLSVSPAHFSALDGSHHSDAVPTPRTSRSHLLAGLRTAPKSATVPSAAHRQQHVGLEGSRYASPPNRAGERVPQTATGAGFPQHSFAMNQGMNSGMNPGRHPMYTLPEQVLAPPSIDFGGDMPMDDTLYAELMSTNLFLAAQQQRLQQQLINVTAAAQQFQGLSLGTPLGQQFASPSVPSMSFYQQQLQQGVQPVVQPVLGQPGLYLVYNPLTGQQNYIFDNTAEQRSSSPLAVQEEIQPPQSQVPTFRAEVSPPPESAQSPVHVSHPVSPPSSSPSPPHDVAPLPPPSANAFRRGHRKSSSFMPCLNKPTIDPSKANNSAISGAPRSAALPPTPMTGMFGPGQGRAGEHPVRQPRGPPSLEDLIAKPTSRFEGSKNFATRQRRRAVHSLVRAGIERRGESRSFGHHSSGGTNTPASEKEFAFSDDDATARSGSLSSKPSLGSLRAAANGAIGSERKERSSRERNSLDTYRSGTPASDDGAFIGSKFSELSLDRVTFPTGVMPSTAAVVAGQRTVGHGSERRKTPMLVLSSAEKRKTMIM